MTLLPTMTTLVKRRSDYPELFAALESNLTEGGSQPSFILPDLRGKFPDSFSIHENGCQEEDDPVTNASKWGTDTSLKLHLRAVPVQPAIGSIWDRGDGRYYKFDGDNWRDSITGDLFKMEKV
jgi:hypothetical protein